MGAYYIEKSIIDNLYYNFKHDTLGLNMAYESGKLISHIINKEKLYK